MTQSDSNRQAKAVRILKLLDRPPERAEAGLAGLLRLPDGDLDAMLNRAEVNSRAMNEALAEWTTSTVTSTSKRKIRPHTKIGCVSETHVRPSRERVQAVIAEELRKHDLKISENIAKFLHANPRIDFSHFESILNTYSSMQADRTTRDIVWLLINSIQNDPSNKIATSAHIKFSTIFESDTIVEFPCTPSYAITLDALAKITSYTEKYAPDVVVSTSLGGKIISDLVRAYLADSSSSHIYIGDNNSINKAAEVELAKLRAGKVLIIDSISRTGETLIRSFQRVKNLSHKNTKINATCFASAFEARDALREALGAEKLFAPIVTPDKRITPPWDSKGQYSGTQNLHRLGVQPTGKPAVPAFDIPKSTFQLQAEYTKANQSSSRH